MAAAVLLAGGPRAHAVPAATPGVVAALAPVVYLHSSETSFPHDPDRFVLDSELRWNHDGGCPDERLAGRGAIVHASLGHRDGRYRARKADNALRRCRRVGRTFEPADHTRPFDDGSATGQEGFFLRHLGPPGGTRVGPWPVLHEHVPGKWIVYWFFYARSAPVKVTVPVPTKLASRWIDTLGRHEGDWEHIAVRLRGETPVEVAFYSHGRARVVPWASVRKEGGRPVVFVAQGSHASYAAPSSVRGERRCFAGIGCIVDRTERSSRRWEAWRLLGDARAKPWYGFGGAWGRVGGWYRAEGAVGFRRDTSGPLGPSRWKGGIVPAGWR